MKSKLLIDFLILPYVEEHENIYIQTHTHMFDRRRYFITSSKFVLRFHDER